ncbi:MAG: DUF4157 domain-containing protein, partial [Chitinophagaceae bacterium]|nr:DUF4157 domain-containing protein [Chitinophagaceae bacterium]
ESVQLNRELSAKAFTVGNDIYFNDGQYNPNSSEGKHLLAHELTHTVQQGGQSVVKPKLIQRDEEEDRATIREAPPPMPFFDAGMSAEERESTRLEYLAQREAYRERLRNAVLAPLEGRDRADATTFISRLRSLSRQQATLLVNDDVFFTRIRRWFRGKSLWAVFSILYFNNRMPEPYLRLNYAVMNNDARLLTDMLSIVILEYPPDRYFNMLREVCETIFSGDRLLPEILRMIDDRDTDGIAYHLSGRVREVHYEDGGTPGTFNMRTFSNNISANAYFTGSELRVIVRIRFVDGSNSAHCTSAGDAGCQPFYFLGENAHYYDDWQGYITNVWNNKFNVTNGTNTYAITFVPLFLSESGDSDAANVRVLSNTTDRCASTDTWARSYASCWQLRNMSQNTVAHEFGHLIGASDEYNLPGSIQEVTAAGITGLSAEDLSLSTVEGVTGTAVPASTSGSGHTQRSLMASTNSDVYERHLTRLIRLLNESQPAGSARFSIRRRN